MRRANGIFDIRCDASLMSTLSAAQGEAIIQSGPMRAEQLSSHVCFIVISTNINFASGGTKC